MLPQVPNLRRPQTAERRGVVQIKSDFRQVFTAEYKKDGETRKLLIR